MNKYFMNKEKIFKLFKLSLFSIIIFHGLIRPSPSPGESLPFFIGEKLVFQIRWGVVEAGKAVLEVLPSQSLDGIRTNHFILKVKTTSIVDVFYKVRDTMEAYADYYMNRSVCYMKKGYGSDKRDVKVVFDWNNQKALYSNFGKNVKSIDIYPGAFDPLSVFYGIRMHDLKEKEEITFPVTDGKKCFIGKANIVKREIVQLKNITYDTFLIEPELTHFGGVFEKTNNPGLRIWLTADHRRLPVKIQCKVAVGSITGELVGTSNLKP